jgi:hypothetical protein
MMNVALRFSRKNATPVFVARFRMVIKPILQALVLADAVYVDRMTGKFVIAGTFNQLMVFAQNPQDDVPQEPVVDEMRKLSNREIFFQGSPFVYVSLTNVRGKVPLELRYVDLGENTAILKLEIVVAGDDPLRTIEMAVRIPPLMPKVGTYALELLADDELLGSHRVIVVEAPDQDEKPKEN